MRNTVPDHHETDVGVGDGLFGRDADLVVELGTRRQPAAGVSDDERHAVPLDLHVFAVACDTRELLDDRLAATDEPVEQRRLADVRPSADDHDGKSLRVGRRDPGHGGRLRPALCLFTHDSLSTNT
jgi:hypothetical protein